MNEVTSILIALGALIVGLVLLGWAFGDFNRPRQSSSADEKKPAGSA